MIRKPILSALQPDKIFSLTMEHLVHSASVSNVKAMEETEKLMYLSLSDTNYMMK